MLENHLGEVILWRPSGVTPPEARTPRQMDDLREISAAKIELKSLFVWARRVC